MNQKYQCWSCDAVFKVKNFVEEFIQDQYEVYYCPYCGGDIEDDQLDNDDDLDEDD